MKIWRPYLSEQIMRLDTLNDTDLVGLIAQSLQLQAR